MQIQLPYSDELNIGYLSRLFDNTSNCYKYFWFLAILRKVDENSTSFSFNELIDEMIAEAWYMVTEYNLRLGPSGTTDNLEEVIKYIFSEYKMPSSEKREKIISFLGKADDKEIRKYKSFLILNVPYRLQVPFYDETFNKKKFDSPLKELMEHINQQNRLIYYFTFSGGLSTRINVNDIWVEYLVRNREILRCWTQLNLIKYLQARNPSVPGIADKLEPPITRKIEKIRDYWRLLSEVDPSIKDIYADVKIADISISVDHFVPWQYVAHDELWNLHPTTKSINSSKNNSLPTWNLYFEPLADLEYRAYELKNENETVKRKFEDIARYHLNNSEIRNRIYATDLDRVEFKNRLEKVIRPVYDAALQQGFKEWTYEGVNN